MQWTKTTIVRKRVGVALALVTAITATTFTFAAPASASWDHIHTIHSVAHRELCLDVKYNHQANGTPVWLYSCNNSDAQNWTFKSLGVDSAHGYERFQIIDPYGYCLDAPAQFGNAANHQVQIWGCNGGSTQIWRQTPGGLNPFVSQVHFAMQNEYNKLWLDDQASGGLMAPVVTYTSNYGANQQWVW